MAKHTHRTHGTKQVVQVDDPDRIRVSSMFWGLMLAVAGFALLRMALKRAAIVQELQIIPLAKLRSAAMGHTKLMGKARAHEGLLEGPFSAVPCVWYRWEVCEYKLIDSDHQQPPEVIARGESEACFEIADEEGAVAVDPRGGTFYHLRDPRLWDDKNLRPGGWVPTGPLASAWIDSHEHIRRDRLVREWHIVPGETVSVVGVLKPGHLADGTRMPVLAQGNAPGPLIIELHYDTGLEVPSAGLVRVLRVAGLVCLVAGLGLAIESGMLLVQSL